MKQTLFGANFEQSQKIVTKRYLVDSFNARITGRYQDYPLGFFVMVLIAMGAYCYSIIEFGKQILEKSTHNFVWSTVPIWFILPFTIYILSLLKWRKKKSLFHFHINFNCVIVMIPASVCALILGSALVVFSTGIPLIGVIWIIIGLIIMMWFSWKTRNDLIQILYEKKSNQKRLFQLLDKFVVFSKKYGWIVIGLIVLGRTFLHFDLGTVTVSDGTQRGLLDYLTFLAFPLWGIIAYMFSVAIAEHHLQGFYLAKYYEEYRLYYGFTEEEWYEGDISKEQFEQLKVEADEERKAKATSNFIEKSKREKEK